MSIWAIPPGRNSGRINNKFCDLCGLQENAFGVPRLVQVTIQDPQRQLLATWARRRRIIQPMSSYIATSLDSDLGRLVGAGTHEPWSFFFTRFGFGILAV
jgi:hypothetical protein